MTFGESLTNARKEKGISRKDFAEQLQIPYTTLRNYETDQREPGHKLLIKMATLLHVSVDDLIGFQAQEKKKPPSAAEAVPGEDVSAMFDKLNSLLVSEGVIKDGEDLTDRQAEILLAVCQIINAAF